MIINCPHRYDSADSINHYSFADDSIDAELYFEAVRLFTARLAQHGYAIPSDLLALMRTFPSTGKDGSSGGTSDGGIVNNSEGAVPLSRQRVLAAAVACLLFVCVRARRLCWRC